MRKKVLTAFCIGGTFSDGPLREFYHILEILDVYRERSTRDMDHWATPEIVGYLLRIDCCRHQDDPMRYYEKNRRMQLTV